MNKTSYKKGDTVRGGPVSKERGGTSRGERRRKKEPNHAGKRGKSAVTVKNAATCGEKSYLRRPCQGGPPKHSPVQKEKLKVLFLPEKVLDKKDRHTFYRIIEFLH